MKKPPHTSEIALMELPTKPSFLRNFFVKILLFCVFIICFRFAYVVTIRGESCDVGDFCFFSLPETFNFAGTTTISAVSSAAVASSDVVSSDHGNSLYRTKKWRKSVQFYSSIFQDLISEGFVTPQSKSLCVDTQLGEEVFALKEIGVSDAIGVSKKSSKPLVVGMKNSGRSQPFDDNTFDFVFYGGGGRIDELSNYGDMAEEIGRTLKPEGYLVVHTRTNDTYSFHSFISLFNCCAFIKSREIQGFYDDNNDDVVIREIVMKKEEFGSVRNSKDCSVVPGYKQEIVRKAEELIEEEPLKPWITLKRNIQSIKYLPSMVDISFKSRYIYVDVGARSYGSSIGSWFRKQYPKQNKTFEVYAIEADKSFHQEYEAKKKWVKLLPYAAWVKNETLFFEVNHDPGVDPDEAGSKKRGMGRIKPVQSNDGVSDGVDKIPGFDFAEWLKETVTEKDFVVMKMDVEGTEFDLIPRLFETGAICLIDEIFLECHYNRWQRCCPGERSAKYEKTYEQCLDLFTSLRERGVLVHQWW
ncbi:Demethylmenaquinone methyltransferase [Bienertia sinuspersici]